MAKQIATRRLFRNTFGANLVEYTILVGLVALIGIAGFKLFGKNVTDKIKGQAGTVSSINSASQ